MWRCILILRNFFTGYLIEKLNKSGLYDDVNIIITSDHGMANLVYPIPILPYIDMNKVEHVLNFCTGAGIWPKPGIIYYVAELFLLIEYFEDSGVII